MLSTLIAVLVNIIFIDVIRLQTYLLILSVPFPPQQCPIPGLSGEYALDCCSKYYDLDVKLNQSTKLIYNNNKFICPKMYQQWNKKQKIINEIV